MSIKTIAVYHPCFLSLLTQYRIYLTRLTANLPRILSTWRFLNYPSLRPCHPSLIAIALSSPFPSTNSREMGLYPFTILRFLPAFYSRTTLASLKGYTPLTRTPLNILQILVPSLSYTAFSTSTVILSTLGAVILTPTIALLTSCSVSGFYTLLQSPILTSSLMSLLYTRSILIILVICFSTSFSLYPFSLGAWNNPTLFLYPAILYTLLIVVAPSIYFS